MQATLFHARPYLVNVIYLLLVLAALVGLYWPILVHLVLEWSKNDNYTHGFLIPLVSGFMIFTIRSELKNITLRPVNSGLLLLLVGLVQLCIGKVGSDFFLQTTSILLVVIGVVLFLLGNIVARRLLLPIGYLVFMIPLPTILWNAIAFPMQLFSSFITEKVVQLIGIPVFREGNVLFLAQTTLEVVDACSGLRSLVTMFALSAFFAWFSNLCSWRKWALFFSAAPIAILANIARLTFTAVLARMFGGEVAQGFLHDISGIFIFVVGLLLLATVRKILYN